MFSCFLTWLWGEKWTEMMENVTLGSILKSACWGFDLIFILFLRKCCSAFKLKVWISLIYRVSSGGNLSPDSKSVMAKMKLPISGLLHPRGAGQGQQMCWNQEFRLKSWIKETWFSTATQNCYLLCVLLLVPECSCLWFVVSCFTALLFSLC